LLLPTPAAAVDLCCCCCCYGCQKRNRGEKLVVIYDMDKWPKYYDFAKYVNTQARAIIGPHGGLMENIRWV
jgi:hypothetical protein